MKKIVILGGLGYLGTELCRIYSGESWKNKILAIDSRFISERVSQLKDWGIEFVHGEILDFDFLKKHLHDADVVHHLAGITDVAYVKTESNLELDNRITSIGVDGTKNAYRAVPVTDIEHDRVDREHRLGIVFRILTGFPPRYFVRLDPS